MNFKIFAPALLFVLCSNIFASDFNMPTINASGLGTAYAGWAADTDDASTAYANAAGLTSIHSSQLVLTGIGVKGFSQFKGRSNIGSGTATSSIGGLIPSYYFTKPLFPNFVFAIGTATPFAFGTNYAKDSLVRYSATLSKITVSDFVSSIGFKINEQFSIGGGVDLERLAYLTRSMVPGTVPDSETHNHLYGWGYGWHLGLRYKINPNSRVGLNVISPVMFHARGNSTFYTPTIAYRNTYQRSNIMLPAMVQLGISQVLTDRMTLLGTVFYTRWSVLDKLTLKHVTTPGGQVSVTVPFNDHDTFDYSLGLKFKANDALTLKTGLQIIGKSSNDQTRTVADTTSNSRLISIGAHYQASKSLSYDVGYAHNFIHPVIINHKAGTLYAIGKAYTSDDVVGMQATWNLG